MSFDNLQLTKYFSDAWVARVGGQASVEAVRKVLRQSVTVQTGEDLYTAKRSKRRVLGIYWHPELNLVIKVDMSSCKAVTVLSLENWQRMMRGIERRRNRETDAPVPPAPTGAITTRRRDSGIARFLRSR